MAHENQQNKHAEGYKNKLKDAIALRLSETILQFYVQILQECFLRRLTVNVLEKHIHLLGVIMVLLSTCNCRLGTKLNSERKKPAYHKAFIVGISVSLCILDTLK